MISSNICLCKKRQCRRKGWIDVFFVDDLGFDLECADGFFGKSGLSGNLCDWCMPC